MTCSYKGNEFIRIGYYVNNELEGSKQNMEVCVYSIFRSFPSLSRSSLLNLLSLLLLLHVKEENDQFSNNEMEIVEVENDRQTDKIRVTREQLNKIKRSILAEKPRVTRFDIAWD